LLSNYDKPTTAHCSYDEEAREEAEEGVAEEWVAEEGVAEAVTNL
jgi:hypothetical protein